MLLIPRLSPLLSGVSSLFYFKSPRVISALPPESLLKEIAFSRFPFSTPFSPISYKLMSFLLKGESSPLPRLTGFIGEHFSSSTSSSIGSRSGPFPPCGYRLLAMLRWESPRALDCYVVKLRMPRSDRLCRLAAVDKEHCASDSLPLSGPIIFIIDVSESRSRRALKDDTESYLRFIGEFLCFFGDFCRMKSVSDISSCLLFSEAGDID